MRGPDSLESGQAGATRLFAAGATAIVCASDPLALGAVRAAQQHGLRVPDDVSVVGFDDSFLMSCTEPPLSTVRQPIESMGAPSSSCCSRRSRERPSPATSCSSSRSWCCEASTGPAAA